MQAPPAGTPAPADFQEPVVVYVTPWCGYCTAAKRLLESKKIAHAVIDVTSKPEARKWLERVTGRHTVPQIFIKGRSIGGYTDLAAMDREGSLDRELASDDTAHHSR